MRSTTIMLARYSATDRCPPPATAESAALPAPVAAVGTVQIEPTAAVDRAVRSARVMLRCPGSGACAGRLSAGATSARFAVAARSRHGMTVRLTAAQRRALRHHRRTRLLVRATGRAREVLLRPARGRPRV